MTVGLPGAGIGGIFYLLSALLMPFHALGKSLLDAGGVPGGAASSRPPWGLIWRQFATALVIIACLWITGWAIAAFLISHPTALGQIQTTQVGKRLPNVLRVAAIAVSLGTLLAVLAAVQIARLVVASESREQPAGTSRAIRFAALIFVLVITPAAAAQTAVRNGGEASRHIAIADRAFAEDDTALARREYEAALAADPSSSRALYRLGQLARGNPRIAESFFRRYVAEESGDTWGWIALGNALAAQRRYSPALDSYARAAAMAPAERDVLIGRARILAASGRTDEAISAYEGWTSAHATDAEALRELAAQRRRAGRYREAERAYSAALALEPSDRARSGLANARGFAASALELQTGGSSDSEENRTVRGGAAASVQITDRSRMKVAGGRRWLSGFSDVTIDDASLGLTARPLAAFRVEANGGVARPRSTSTITDTIPGTGTGNGNGRGRGRSGTPPPGTIVQRTTESADNIFTGSFRSVWRQPGGHSSLDLRATRTLLDATPVLAINRVVRNEVAGRADIAVLPRIRLRGGARAGSYNATGDDNTRLSLLGGVALSATDAIEVSGIFQRLTFARSTTSGYFAPRVAQLAEGGTYAELESDGGTVLAIDGGIGAQRLAEFGGVMGEWKPSYRLFASLDIPMRPGSWIHFDVDSYDSRLGSDVPTTAASWRFISLSASLRLGLH